MPTLVALLTLLALFAAPVAAQATYDVGAPDLSGTRDYEIDASNYNGTSITIWVNGFEVEWDWSAEPTKKFPVATGGTFRIKTDNSEMKSTNNGATYTEVFGTGAGDGDDLTAA